MALFYFLFVLLCKDLFEPCISGQGVLQRQLRLSLNKRQYIVYKFMLEAVAIGVNPFQGDLLLIVCHGGEGEKYHFAVVFTVNVFPLKSDHLSGGAGNSLLNGFLACTESFLNVCLGG